MMESFRLIIICLGVVYTAARGITYDLPWFTDPATKAPCATDVCKEFQKLCLNGGRCETTPECGARCTCLKGFTGFFCGVKVKNTLTTGRVLLDALQNTASDKVKNIVPALAAAKRDESTKMKHTRSTASTVSPTTTGVRTDKVKDNKMRVTTKNIMTTDDPLRAGKSSLPDTRKELGHARIGTQKQQDKVKPATVETVTLGAILEGVKGTDSVTLVTGSSGGIKNVELKNSG